MSAIPVAVLSARATDRPTCQRCGLSNPDVREVDRVNPWTERETRYRWCGQCRGEQDQASEPATEPADEDGGTRRCPSCEQDKPVAGWANNWVGLSGRVALVCADCKPPVPPDRTAGYPRFTAQITLDPGQRRILAGELVVIGAGHPVLAAIIAQLQAAADESGPVDLDVDVSTVSLADRSRIGLAFEAAVLHRHPAVHAVRRAWLDWLRPQLRAGDEQRPPALR